MGVRVKICGITNRDDALAAAAAGADALGFMFYEPSPRHLSLAVAAEIIRALPPFIAKVGVFVDAPAEFVQRAIAECGLDTVQLHGDESPEYCRQFTVQTIKAFRVRNEETLKQLPAYETSAWLLDSYVPGQPGGTGARFNWEVARAATRLGRPVILAGGLTPANVAAAVREVRPFGLDVSSGVESGPGRKDHAKVMEFIAAAKAAGATRK